jgi:hypothetical protein
MEAAGPISTRSDRPVTVIAVRKALSKTEIFRETSKIDEFALDQVIEFFRRVDDKGFGTEQA